MLVITQLFNLFFVLVVFDRYAPTLKHAALALSTSLGAVLNAWWLYRGCARGALRAAGALATVAWRLVAATAFATVAILIARPDDGWWVAKASGTLDVRWAARHSRCSAPSLTPFQPTGPSFAALAHWPRCLRWAVPPILACFTALASVSRDVKRLESRAFSDRPTR